MKRTYECMLLLDNREVKKGWDQLKSSVTGVFEKHGAEVVSARRWDERRLAFQIKRQKRATYLLMYFNAETPQVQALRRDLQFSETVLRNFVMSCDKVPEEAFEPEASFDISTLQVDEEPAAPSRPRDSGAAAKPEASGKAEGSEKTESSTPAAAAKAASSGDTAGDAAGDAAGSAAGDAAAPSADSSAEATGGDAVTGDEKPAADDEEKSK